MAEQSQTNNNIMILTNDNVSDMVSDNLLNNPKVYVPIISKQKHNHDKLLKWLRSRCDYSDDAFKDQDYSPYYKSMFNIMDIDGMFYEKDDIDHELNIGYVDYGEGEIKHPKDEELEHFIDSAFNEIKTSENKNNVCDHNIVILPGTNHSNANYVYKIIKYEAVQKNQYNIPYLTNNSKISYKGDHKEASMMINKEDVYKFIMNNSIIKKY